MIQRNSTRFDLFFANRQPALLGSPLLLLFGLSADCGQLSMSISIIPQFTYLSVIMHADIELSRFPEKVLESIAAKSSDWNVLLLHAPVFMVEVPQRCNPVPRDENCPNYGYNLAICGVIGIRHF